MLWPHRGRILASSVALLVWTGADLVTPYLFKIAIDLAVVPRRLAALNLVALAYVGVVGLRAVTGALQARTVATVGQQTLDAIRRRLFAHLLRLPLTFYQTERAGGIVARMVGDVDATSGLVSSGMVELAAGVVTFASIATILVWLDWRLALTTLILAPALAAAVAWYRARSRAAWRGVRESASAATVALQEVVTGAGEIQAYGRESSMLDRLAAVNERVRAATRRTVLQGAVFFPGVELISGLASVVVIGFGGPQVLAGRLDIGTLTAFLLYLRVLFGPVFNLSELYDTVQAATAGAERIGAALAVPPMAVESAHPRRLARPRGHLHVDGVRFAYPGTDTAEAPVLRHVDLEVPAGSTLALVGPTGAGKSTLARLILRFHDPLAGRIVLDGIDLRELHGADLRRAVGFAPQEGFLFSGTVEENIRFGRPGASRAQIAEAATALGVWPLLDRLPTGLDTQVGERGDQLASGERQVVAFLRAWVANPALLVLDEATSHLDPDTDTRLRHALARLRDGRTSVIIAHRLVNVLDADQVAVIAGGRVAEVGAPSRLIAAGGIFTELYARWLEAHPPGG